MATGGEPPIEDSDIFYEFACTLCEKKNKNVEAIKRCQDCGVNLCGDCLVNHDLFPAMQDHRLVDKKDVGKPLVQDGGCPDLPRVKCVKHPGNRVELFCERHEEVGCATCGNVDHKLCKAMLYVPDVAAGFKATSEPRDVEDSLDSLVNRTARVKKAREEDLKRVTAQRDSAIQNIEQRVDTIKQRLDELKVAAIVEVDLAFGEFETKFTSDIGRIGHLVDKLQNEERRIKAARTLGESDLFVFVKQGRTRAREGEKVVQELEKSRGESLHIVIDDTVLACVNDLETLVKVGGPVELALQIEQKPNVRMAGDQNECVITDCCFLDNGSLLLTDEKNKCIKLFDKSFKALDKCAVDDMPTAVCLIDEAEVAITLFDKKVVKFAKVDQTIHLTMSFSVGEQCRGMSYCNNRLAISCGGGGLGESPGQVRIYDTSGALLQTIRHDNMARPLHNSVTSTGSYIVANRNRGILAFDNTWKFKRQYKHADLKHAVGLCDVDGWILVCCMENGHVFQINPADQSSSILLRGSSELKKPRSMTYDVRNDKLIVTKKYCDYLLVCKINRK